jgi:hypothetical protein
MYDVQTFGGFFIDVLVVDKDVTWHRLFIREALENNDNLVLRHRTQTIAHVAPAQPVDTTVHCKTINTGNVFSQTISIL